MGPRDRTGAGVNLADPGGGRRPGRSTPGFRILGALVILGLVAAGAVLARRPIGHGLGTAASWAGDGVGAVWDAWSDWGGSVREIAATIPEETTTSTEPPPPPGDSRSALMVFGHDRETAAFALLVAPPVGDAELLMLPQTLLVQVPGYGEFTLAESLEFGGARLTRLAVANQLGIRIDATVEAAAGSLAVLGEDMVVDVPVELFVADSDGSRRLIVAGRQRLSADLVELLLTEPGTGDQFEWLRRQEAVWAGIFGALSVSPDLAAGLAVGADDPLGVSALLNEVADTGLIGSPPVDRVAVGGSTDALVLGSGRAADALAERLGHLMLRPEPRPRAEILNGNGVAGSSLPAAEALVADGFLIIRTGNADRFTYTTTQVIAQGEDAVPIAREAAAALGAGELLLEARAPSGVVDVSIIVGTDIAATED